MYKRYRLLLVFLVIGGTVVWLLTSMFEAHPTGVAAAVHHEPKRHKADGGERCVIPSSATPGRVEHLLGILTNNRERSLQIPPEDNMVNMVVTFAYMLDINREGINRSSLEERQNEFVDSMWRNLHHERVWSIHILYEQNKHMQYLIKTVMERAERRVAATAIDIPDPDDCSPSLSASAVVVALLKQKVFMTALEDGKVLEYKRAFEYANHYLSGTLLVVSNSAYLEVVVGLIAWIGNSDIYLGEGWEQLSVANMKSKSKAYSLTRQEVCSNKRENCAHSVNQRNGGSDCFVVVPPVADHLLEAMDHPTNVWGAENNVIYQLSRGGYHVTNPCNVINIIHNHCSGYRPNEATVRVNVPNGRRGSGVSRPASSL